MIKAAYNKTTHLELSQDAISKMEIVEDWLTSKISSKKIKWPCELIGRNSVSPWIKANRKM